MKQYRRRKPKTVRAIQYLREDNIHAVQTFFEDMLKLYPENIRQFRYQAALNEYAVVTQNHKGLTDLHVLQKGEWILREDGNPFQVLSDQKFHQLYERADD